MFKMSSPPPSSSSSTRSSLRKVLDSHRKRRSRDKRGSNNKNQSNARKKIEKSDRSSRIMSKAVVIVECIDPHATLAIPPTKHQSFTIVSSSEEKHDDDDSNVEVEAFQDGKTIYHKIICPRPGPLICRNRSNSLDSVLKHLATPKASIYNCRFENDDDAPLVVSISMDEDDVEQSFLDSLCFHPCSTLFHPKTILRKQKSGNLGEQARRDSQDVPVISDRQVSFSQLKIAEFGMTLGNHPAAVSGPPMMLDWDSQPKERVVTVDEYEESRQPRRKRKHLKLSIQDRQGILFENKGFSPEEVNEAWAEAIQIRKQRQETLNRGIALMFFDDVWESTCRKYQKLTDIFAAWI